MITVYNKCDRLDPPTSYPRRGLVEARADGVRNENVYISAKEDDSLQLLTEVILAALEKDDVTREYVIPYASGNVLSYLMENAKVEILDYLAEGTRVSVRCGKAVAERADKLLK